MPSESELLGMGKVQLDGLRASIISSIAATQSLGPMFADLQARCVNCLNGIGDQLELASVTLGLVDQHIASRPVETPSPAPQSAPDPLPPKFAHILSRVSSCLVAVAGSQYCQGVDADNILSACKFLDSLTAGAPDMPPPTHDIMDATDAIMALPSELRLLDDGDDNSHASKRVRLAHDSTLPASDPPVPPSAAPGPSDPSPPGPDSDPRTALPVSGGDPNRSLPPRKRITGKSPSSSVASSSQCNQWGTMCQVFEIGSPRVIPEVAFVDSAFEIAVSPIVEGSAGPAIHPPPSDCIVSESLSSVESMDEDFASSGEVVRAVPNVKAAASLKAPSLNPNLNLSPQQKRNLAKKLRKKKNQAS